MVKKIITAIILITLIYIMFPASAEECTSCHKIRHGLPGAFCNNCHYNTTISNGRHMEKPFSPGFAHDGFDWEGDNANEKAPDRLNESCPVCHVSMLEHTSQTLNVCEDCHVKEIMKNGKLIAVREDIGNYTPRVYSHFNGSSIDVPELSALGGTKSSCFGYDTKTGEGTCHGVNFRKKEIAGGFFAFNARDFTGKIMSRGDPYHWNAPVDAMPDTGNCAFCHVQVDGGIRKAWGDPRPLPADSAHLDKKNKDCFDCHVDGQFGSFHGKEVVRIIEKSPLNIIIIILLILLIIIILSIAAIFLGKKRAHAHIHKE